MSNLARTNPVYLCLAAAAVILVTTLVSPGLRTSRYLTAFGAGSSSNSYSNANSHSPVDFHSQPSAFTPAASQLQQFEHDDLQRRLRESEQLWSKSVDKREAFYAEQGGIGKVPLFGQPGSFAIWDILTAPFACPHSLERIGRLGDGGKWICGVETLEKRADRAIIYSIGVERESSFEAEVLDRYPLATIHGYDLSVDNWGPQINDNPKYRDRAFFHKFGLSAHDEPEKKPPNFSLKTMMAKNGHDFIDIFKIDVEGAEWDVLDAILKDFDGMELPFGQMQIEVHVPSITVERMDRWWRALEARGLRAFCQEINHATVPVTGMYYCEYCFINVKSTKSPLLGY